MLHQTLTHPRFALTELLLVVLSGVIWVLVPGLGIWFTLLALLPWGVRLFAGEPPFKRSPLDTLVAILLVTAWVGYWAAYDKESAWIKVWLIVTAVLLYYALCAQPEQNLGWLSLFSFSAGIAISIYFFLTNDFSFSMGGISAWWMDHRPRVGWSAIHHGYISGLLVITNIFACYWFWKVIQKPRRRFTLPLFIIIILGQAIVLLGFILTVSRGVWMAMVCGLGVWIIWKVITSNRFASRPGVRSLFPLYVLAYLGIILILTYLGPAQVSGGTGESYYGIHSRAQIFERAAYFLLDYPITGAGLNSFPGLYSQYILGIPNFYFLNSYNMFLDVALEQGVIGGLAFLFIYLGAIWLVARTIVVDRSKEIWFISWLGMFALIFTVVHGFLYDYLYNGHITPLLLFPVGFSMIGVLNSEYPRQNILPFPAAVFFVRKYYLPMVIVLVFGMVTVLVPNRYKMVSIWYSDLGAVEMDRIVLDGFPANKWDEGELTNELQPAKKLFIRSLKYDPTNWIASYHLGLIEMSERDFSSASEYLAKAFQQAPSHRGVTKNLGYSYAWLGEMDKARQYLEEIPEAKSELDVYTWWWHTQGRQDLSTNASWLASEMNRTTNEP